MGDEPDLAIDFEQLRSFALGLELGSFSVAADRLGVTQPAVSVATGDRRRRRGGAGLRSCG